MRGGRFFLLLAGIGLFLFLLLALPASHPEAKKPLQLYSVALEEARNDRPQQLLAAGAGFDAQTRLLLVPEIGNRQALLQTIPTWGRLESTTLAGNLLYLANHYRGMQVFDFSDPDRPQQIGSLPLPGNAWKIAVRGQIACVAAREGGLLIVDISDPAHLRLLSEVQTDGFALDVLIAGDLAYIANSRRGLQVIDIADSAKPRLLSTLPIPGHPCALQAKDGKIFIAAAGGGLQIVDAGDPRQLRLIGALHLPDAALDLTFHGDTVVIAGSRKGLFVAEVSRPEAPRLLATVDTPSVARAVAVAGERAYVADYSAGLQVIDLADRRHPQLLGGYQVSGTAQSVTISGQRALVATGRNGLQILDLQRPPTADRRSALSAHAAVRRSSAADYTFFPAQETGVLVLDGNSTPPFAQAARIPTDGFVRQIEVSGNTLTVLNYQQVFSHQNARFTLQMIDITDLENSQTLSRFDTGGGIISSFALAGSDIWTLDEEGVCRFDIGEPRTPRKANCLPLSGKGGEMVKKGDLLVVGEKTGLLQVIDIARPEAPRRIGTATLPWHLQEFSAAYTLVLQGDLALLADGRNGLLVYTLADPRQPKLVGGVQVPEAGFAGPLQTLGRLAYVADFRQGLHLIDFTDPQNLQIVCKIGNSGTFYQIMVAAGRLLYANAAWDIRSTPLPTEPTDVVVENESRLRAALAGPLPPGRYTVIAFDGKGRAELPTAVVIER